MVSERCPWEARAYWGDELLARTTAAVQLEEPGQPPALYFPVTDVHFERMRDDGHQAICPVKGAARLWSATAPATGGPPPSMWRSADRDPDGDGDGDICWRFTEPAPGFEWMADMAAFDHDRVRVELVDTVAGEAERDITVKRFPTWGDAADLIAILDVRPDGDNAYVSVARGEERRPIVEGSQMLGQAIVAAGHQAPGRRVVSAHMVFMRAADAREPLRFDVEPLSAGRTFTTLLIHVSQAGRRCATGTFLLDTMAPDVVRHSVPAPNAPGPYECEPYDMSVTGRDLRVADAAYTDDPAAPVGPPIIDAWVRFRAVPDDPCVHAALLAQFTGHMSIAAALRPHAGVGQRDAHRTLSTGINAIAISMHRDVRADEWMLYHHDATFAGDGMTHAECRVHDESGQLLASFTVDAMVRPMAHATGPVDERTAM